MTKTNLAQVILSLIQNEGFINSFKLKYDSIEVKFNDKRTVTINLSEQIDDNEHQFISDMTVGKTNCSFATSENISMFQDVSLRFNLQESDAPSNHGSIIDYYAIGKQFVESYKEANRKRLESET